VQAGNFQLPASDDDVGTKAIKRMRVDSIFLRAARVVSWAGAP